MRSQLWAAVALAALWAAPPLSAQVGQVGVTVQLLYNVETVFAADFAPYNVGQQPDFLSITLQNGSSGAQSIVLEVAIRQERPRAAQLFRGNTDPFTLGAGVRRITNRDLSNTRSDVTIEDYDISSDADDLTDRILQTGRFPSGTYVFRVSALRAGTGALLGQGEVRLDLVNPTRLELVGPGRPFGDNPDVISTPSPRFQWTADEGVARGSGTYRIRVVPADGAASPEAAMQAYPSWEATTTATTALYPGAVSAIPLAPGKTYAWQVTREVRTSGGNVYLASPIYWFRMAGGGEGPRVGSQDAGANLGAGVQLDRFGSALGLGNRLQGFRPTGQMLVDGKPASAENLEALLRAILAGEITVRSVTVR